MTTVRRQPLAWRDPWAVAQALAEAFGREGLVWLDGDGSPLGRSAILAAAPLDQRCCRGRPGEPGATDPLATLAHLPPGHWMGWLSYGAGAWVEPAAHWPDDTMANLWLARHDPVLHFDLVDRRLWLEGTDGGRMALVADLVTALPAENGPLGTGLGTGLGTVADRGSSPGAERIDPASWIWHSTPQQFAAGVEQILEWIAAGDLFQANLTACCEVLLREQADPLALYGRLRRACPAPFAGLVIAAGEAAGEALLSASPERFLQVSENGQVETRPIKGTRPRHRQPDRDAAAAVDLISSSKDRAENVMIVDLLRNDLGRVCQPGSISVPQLVGLESYPQVHHLTSVVTGQLAADRRWVDLLRACWPGGSISGAPKVRACRRLSDLEPVSRGAYCGSMLKIGWGNQFDSSILIRTLLVEGQRLRAHAGCGIVADSEPWSEAEELGWKLEPLLQALA